MGILEKPQRFLSNDDDRPNITTAKLSIHERLLDFEYYETYSKAYSPVKVQWVHITQRLFEKR